jgi:hypothetical protein
MIRTAQGSHLRAALLAMAMLAAALVALAGARLAQAAFPDEALPDGHGPIAFEKDGDIWVATKMHLANLTPDTPHSSEVEPAVSPDGRWPTCSPARRSKSPKIGWPTISPPGHPTVIGSATNRPTTPPLHTRASSWQTSRASE